MYDLLIAIIKLYTCFDIPYTIAYYKYITDKEYFKYYFIIDAILLVDILLKFFSAQIRNAKIVDDHK